MSAYPLVVEGSGSRLAHGKPLYRNIDGHHERITPPAGQPAYDVYNPYLPLKSLFGQPMTAPSHDGWGQIVDTDGTVLLCLHQWGAHEHPSLMSPDEATPGNGLLLFFRVDDFDASLKRARALVTRFAEEPHVNPNTQTREFSLRDPDGYYVTISALPAPQ